MAVAAAEVPEGLPPVKRSRTEAKEEDVEMDAPEEELKGRSSTRDPQDAEMPATEEALDFGDADLDDVSETSSQQMQRANLLMNSDVLQQYADSEDEEGEESRLGPRPRYANPAMARFISQFLQSDREFLDQLLEADSARRQRRHEEGIPFVEIQPNEEVRYGEELDERKAQDIFYHTSTQDFMAALRPEADENLSSARSSLALHLCAGRENYQRLHSNKMSLLQSLEPEPKVKIEIPRRQPAEDPMTVEPEYECALDRLGQLGKQHKNKYFGFDGKYFRESHGRSLNFYKYRMPNPVGHPHLPFDFDEEKFIHAYVEFFSHHQLLKNTFMDALLCMVVKIIAFELPMMNHKKNDQERLRQTLKKGSCS